MPAIQIILPEQVMEAFKDVDMSAGNPDRPIIASKSLDHTYEEMEAAIHECLDALGIDRIDIFKMHEVRQEPDWSDRAGAWQCLLDYKAKGIVKAIGVSTHHIDVVERMASVPECDIVFPLINYAGLGIRKGSHPGSAEEMAAAIKKICEEKPFSSEKFSGNFEIGVPLKSRF